MNDEELVLTQLLKKFLYTVRRYDVIYNCPNFDSIVSYFHHVHFFTTFSSKIHFNTNLPYRSILTKRFLT